MKTKYTNHSDLVHETRVAALYLGLFALICFFPTLGAVLGWRGQLHFCIAGYLAGCLWVFPNLEHWVTRQVPFRRSHTVGLGLYVAGILLYYIPPDWQDAVAAVPVVLVVLGGYHLLLHLAKLRHALHLWDQAILTAAASPFRIVTWSLDPQAEGTLRLTLEPYTSPKLALVSPATTQFVLELTQANHRYEYFLKTIQAAERSSLCLEVHLPRNFTKHPLTLCDFLWLKPLDIVA